MVQKGIFFRDWGIQVLCPGDVKILIKWGIVLTWQIEYPLIFK